MREERDLGAWNKVIMKRFPSSPQIVVRSFITQGARALAESEQLQSGRHRWRCGHQHPADARGYVA
jgi:hypothetical protein